MKNYRADRRCISLHRRNLRIACMCVALALAACASAPTPQSANSARDTSLQQLLDKAHASTVEMRTPYLLDAAALALQDKNTASAAQILGEIDTLKLNSQQHARRQLLTARLAMLQRHPEQAINALQDRQLLQSLDQLTAAEQVDVSLLRAQAFYATGNYFASAQERVFVEPLLKSTQIEENHNEIRRALTNMSGDELQRQRATARNDVLRGWLDLAIAAKENPAALRNAPSALTTLSGALPFDALTADQPRQVALILPLSGKLAAFGEAVRDGFLAALYAAQQQGERIPEVRIYDSDSAGIVQLYQQALSDGAGAVVGPLEKLQVAQFYAQSLPAPLLALNRADSTQPPPANLYQFGLAPEDETAELAQVIAHDDKHNVLIIADANDANSREAQAFLQQWH
ncbi:MAG TPA: penicillin-binding protein activator, partial [Spongiibacteraceae bacterium]|nr:penicillin-binding protein activator [Spongiibacteraceae bacterium]